MMMMRLGRSVALPAALLWSGTSLLLISSSVVNSFVITTTTKTRPFNNHNKQHWTTAKQRRSMMILMAEASTATTTTEQQQQEHRGDARGAALLMENVAISRGSAPILSDLHWRVEPTSSWGLVGPNGAGKSSLLKAILGEILLDDGQIVVGTTQTVGYLQQTAVSGSNRTIQDEAASAMTTIEQAKHELEQAETRVEMINNDDNSANDQDESKALAALDRATERFQAVGGYTQEQQVHSVLKGLGFHNMSQTCDELSGGWQMRVSLAKLLLSKPSLLLLDEPSNHLDVNARQWLATYLQRYQDGAMILVTHDVDLLKAVSHIAEVSGGTLHTYKSCTYTEYLKEKQQRQQAATAEYEKNVAKAAKLQAFVDRFGASATKASAAQSRVKQLEKMERNGLLTENEQQQPKHHHQPTLVLPDPPRSIGETLLELKNAQVGYDASTPFMSNIQLEIKRGMKLLLRGPNGAGKSTILHSLRGTLSLLQGERTENEALRLGVFTQDLAQELDGTARAVDLVTAYAREGPFGDVTLSDQEARSVMGRLGLSNDKPLRLVKDLSGGEKARVALAMFAVKASNLLILDEPSNHLDRECVKALSHALSDWGQEDGAVVVVSHDKAFCREIGFTHVGTVENGKLVVEDRSATERDWDMFSGVAAPSLGNGGGGGGGGDKENTDSSFPTNGDNDKSQPNKEMDRQLKKQAYNAPKRIAKLERWIEEAEGKIARLDSDMLANGSDVEKLMELTAQKEEQEARVMKFMDEWEQLEELLAQLPQ